MKDLVSSFYERMGLNAYATGDPGAAEKWFRRLATREPDSLRSLRNLGAALAAKGDTEAAAACILREEELYGPSYHRHRALADLAFAAGRREDALERYGAALAERDAPASGDRALAETRLAICRDPEAFARSRRAAARFAEGEAARDSGDPRGAVEAFEAAAALDPSHWPALNNAGTLYLDALREPARALSLFERAADLAPSPQCARNAQLARDALVAAGRTPSGRPGRERRKAAR